MISYAINKKEKRQIFLGAVLDKFMKTDPKLSEREVAEVIVMELGDISSLLEAVKKEAKKV